MTTFIAWCIIIFLLVVPFRVGRALHQRRAAAPSQVGVVREVERDFSRPRQTPSRLPGYINWPKK